MGHDLTCHMATTPQDATDSGVLNGHVETSHLDLKESAAFLESVLHQRRLCLRCQMFGQVSAT